MKLRDIAQKKERKFGSDPAGAQEESGYLRVTVLSFKVKGKSSERKGLEE